MMDYTQLPPEVWAYMGDAVFELLVRRHFVLTCGTKAGDLHKRTTAVVNASAQAKMVRVLRPYLTEIEWEVVKRGRNNSARPGPRGASVQDYRYSTGLEALFGFLYLKGDEQRAEYLLALGLGRNDTDGCTDCNDDRKSPQSNLDRSSDLL